jgi:hypothetical protein
LWLFDLSWSVTIKMARNDKKITLVNIDEGESFVEVVAVLIHFTSLGVGALHSILTVLVVSCFDHSDEETEHDDLEEELVGKLRKFN